MEKILTNETPKPNEKIVETKSTSTPNSLLNDDKFETLMKLKKLRDNEVLTEEEFQKREK